MKKCKKILLLLLAVVTITGTTNVYAKNEAKLSTNYQKTCVTTDTKDNVSTYYGISYKIGKKPGQFSLTAKHGTFKITAIEQGYYYGATNKFSPKGPVTYLKGSVNNYINNNNALVVAPDENGKGAKTVDIEAESFENIDLVPTGADFVLRFTLVPAVSDNKCQSPEDFAKAAAEGKDRGTFVEYIYIVLRNFKATKAKTEPNTNYNLPACQTIRSAQTGYPINVNNSIDENAFNNIVRNGDPNSNAKITRYISIVPFCFYPGEVVQNYDEKQVKTMVQTAIQSAYAVFLPQTVTKDQNWEASEIRACQAAGGTWQGWGQCTATGETWQILNEGEKAKSTSGLYCKYDWNSLGQDNSTKGYKYTNINSYYAKTTKTTTGSYKYQYSSVKSNSKEVSNNSCTRTCEEVVDVEYGPPQTAIAGFCIEYQVKVTSHVKCTTTSNIQPPEQGTMCVPVPICVHSWGERNQGGPSEEFDSCVQKCDGGKYSDTCSTKCYNEVYKSTSKTKNLSTNEKTNIVQFVSQSKSELPTGGHYDRKETNDGLSTIWVPDRTSEGRGTYGYGTYAEWYFINEENRTIEDHGKYFADAGGFKRQAVGDTGACNGNCTHEGCNDDEYLDSNRMNTDYAENMERYNNMVSECVAKATCTEATATFTIEADVKVNGKNIGPIKFPMNKQEDTLHTTGKGGVRTENQITEGSSLLSYNGCYDKTDNKDWYQAEWSFPGTWANNKTGEISYIDKGNDATWHQTKNKFCLPLTIDNTNQTWWYYYMNKKSATQTASNKGSYLSQEYKKAHPEVVNQNSVPSNKSIDWNIRAQTMRFGYFEWQFNINCFYATYAEDNCVGSNCGKNTPDNFTTRTIAKNDMFPSTKEDDTTGVTDSTQTGRTQGFNWTSAATIDESKSQYYAVNPEVLIAKIQKLGDKVYDESYENEYLEYEFRLSSEDLKEIKRDSRSANMGNGNYTNYDNGSFSYDSKKKIYIYTSPLIRGKKYTAKSPDESLLGCNNISSNKCEVNLGGND